MELTVERESGGRKADTQSIELVVKPQENRKKKQSNTQILLAKHTTETKGTTCLLYLSRFSPLLFSSKNDEDC